MSCEFGGVEAELGPDFRGGVREDGVEEGGDDADGFGGGVKGLCEAMAVCRGFRFCELPGREAAEEYVGDPDEGCDAGGGPCELAVGVVFVRRGNDGLRLRLKRLGFCEGLTGVGREDAFEVFLDHRQGAADEVAVAVGEVAVVALDEGVEGEAAVLAEGDFAEEEVAEDVGGEEVLVVFGEGGWRWTVSLNVFVGCGGVDFFGVFRLRLAVRLRGFAQDDGFCGGVDDGVGGWWGAEGAEGFEDGFGADDVAAGF